MPALYDLLDPYQQENIFNWDREHIRTCPIVNRQVAIGGRLTYSFTPSSLGLVIKVKCACGEEIDVTEYRDW